MVARAPRFTNFRWVARRSLSQPRVVKPTSNLSSDNPRGIRMYRIDKDVLFLGHDDRRDAQYGRANRSNPNRTKINADVARRLSIPANWQARCINDFCGRPQVVWDFDLDQVSVEWQPASIEVNYCFKTG